jgi:hypothetical protein
MNKQDISWSNGAFAELQVHSFAGTHDGRRSPSVYGVLVRSLDYFLTSPLPSI